MQTGFIYNISTHPSHNHSINSIGQMLELLDIVQRIRTKHWFLTYSCMVLLDGIYLAHKFNGNGNMQICHIFGYECIENADCCLLYGLLHLIYFNRFLTLIQTLFMEEWISSDLDGFICIIISIIILLHWIKSARIRILIIHDFYLLINISIGLNTYICCFIWISEFVAWFL